MSKQGDFVVERWATSFEKDSYTINSYEAHGNGKPFQHVTGTFKRVKSVEASATSAKVKGFFPPTKEMGFLSKWVGNYRMKGWMVMPGAGKMDIMANETVNSIFGGLGIELQLKGDPVPQIGGYEGWGAMIWNPEIKSYQSLWLDNQGTAALEKAHVVNGKLVVGSATLVMGTPYVSRSVFGVSKDGSMATVKEHSMVGDGDPVHSFQATYTKQ